MNLSRMFQSKAEAFRETVKTDDLPRMEELMQKKGFDFFLEFLKTDYMQDLTPRMAELLFDKMDDALLDRWEMRSGKQDVTDIMLRSAISKNRLEVAEFLLPRTGTVFNQKSGSWFLLAVVNSTFDEDVKLRYLRTMLAGGYDKMEGIDKAMKAAVASNLLPAIDLFAAVGFDLHTNNEQYLRSAARDKSAATALHLVTRHGANIDLAISTEMALGNAPVFEFLTELKKQLPDRPAPRTVETLSAEVASLQDTVRELTQKLAKMQSGAPLDKPVLRGPAP